MSTETEMETQLKNYRDKIEELTWQNQQLRQDIRNLKEKLIYLKTERDLEVIF
ncbi:MAG: hypothetical protein ACOC4M_15210 [Promethearchaeia archaeon]